MITALVCIALGFLLGALTVIVVAVAYLEGKYEHDKDREC